MDLTVVALSPRVTIGPAVVLELPETLYAPFTPFRASGRFFQPVCFVILFLLLQLLAARVSRRLATGFLLAVLAVQALDLWPTFGVLARRYTHEATWKHALRPEPWAFAAGSYDRLLLAPSQSWDSDTRVAFAHLAARLGLAINAGEPARLSFAALYAYDQAFARALEDAPLDPTAVYVVRPDYVDAFKHRRGASVLCRAIDGFTACTSTGGTAEP